MIRAYIEGPLYYAGHGSALVFDAVLHNTSKKRAVYVERVWLQHEGADVAEVDVVRSDVAAISDAAGLGIFTGANAGSQFDRGPRQRRARPLLIPTLLDRKETVRGRVQAYVPGVTDEMLAGKWTLRAECEEEL